MEAAVLGSGLDNSVSYTRHLGSDGDVGHALAVGTCRITPEISFKLVAETVLAQTNGHGGGHPEGAAQPRVAVLG